MLLFCNIDADAGFELDREVIGKDGDLLDETFNTILVKVRDGGFLPGDEVLQLLDPVHGFFPAVAVHLGFFFLLPEPENLVGDGVIILLVVGLFDKLLLEFYQPFRLRFDTPILKDMRGFAKGGTFLCLLLSVTKGLPINGQNGRSSIFKIIYLRKGKT